MHLFQPEKLPRLTARRVTLVGALSEPLRVVFPSLTLLIPITGGFNLDGTVVNAGLVLSLCGPDGATPAQQTRIRVMRDRL